MPTLARHRAALFASSTLTGVGIATWVTRTPAVRAELGTNTAGMGLVLLGLSVGSMLGVLASGALVRRVGTAPVVTVGLVAPVLGVLIVAAGAAAHAIAPVWAGLFLVGLGSGLAEIALNVEAADVERTTGRPVVPVLHGCFSLGTVIGAVAGIALTALAVPVAWHLAGAAVAMAGLAVFAATGLRRPGAGRRSATASSGTAQAATAQPAAGPAATVPRLRLLDVRLLCIAAIGLAMAFAEGAASDWLPLLMTDGFAAGESQSALVFAGFAVAMAAGRFAGAPVLARLGRPVTLRLSTAVAVVGAATVVLSPYPVLTIVAALLWGIGIALGFPIAVSAAGDDPLHGDERVSVVASSGYVAFLVGPPVLGFLGEHAGLRAAMVVPLALLVVAFAVASATRPTAVSGPDRLRA